MAAQTRIGTERLQAAQDAKGLSNERIARLIPVSEKTWRRWKIRGEIPTYAMPAVAKALDLEIRNGPGALAAAVGDTGGGEEASLRDEVRELRALVELVLQKLP